MFCPRASWQDAFGELYEMRNDCIAVDLASAAWDMYGLTRGTVRLETDCSKFSALYELERNRIAGALRQIRFEIEHVGSTSVPGLAAKPILDVAVGVTESGLLLAAVELLASNGYNDFGYLRSAGGYVLDRVINGRACVIVHVLIQGSFRWRKYLVLRDYLRCNSDARHNYAQTKQLLAHKFHDDRRAYTSAKRKPYCAWSAKPSAGIAATTGRLTSDNDETNTSCGERRQRQVDTLAGAWAEDGSARLSSG
jgi:GrpB-like predicted nucleotidyltransferase (UPF0157 family)